MAEGITDLTKPVPYENGSHCIFYAVQKASMYFHGRPLSFQERERYQHERRRRVEIKDALNFKANWLEISLQMILSELKENDIFPTKLVCTEEVRKFLGRRNFIKRTGVEFQIVRPGVLVDNPYPEMIFLQRKNDNHVWFCPDKETFNKEAPKHMVGSDKTVLVVSVKAGNPSDL